MAPLSKAFQSLRKSLSRLRSRGASNGVYLSGYNVGRLPGSNRDWAQEAGHLDDNSAVSNLINWVGNQVAKSPVQVLKHKKDNSYEPVPGHALAFLVKRPNAWTTRSLLWKLVVLSWFLDGNFYLYKVPSDAGKPVELLWIPHWLIRPVGAADGSVSHFELLAENGGQPERLEADRIIHGRTGLSRANPLMGRSPLGALLREICTDNEILTYTYSMLKNLGMVGSIISGEDESVTIDGDVAEKIKRAWKVKFGGDNRFEPMVLKERLKIETPSVLKPQEMLVDKIAEIGEARIAGAIGVPAVVVQFIVGLRTSTAKASYAESLKQAYDCCVEPLQREICEWLDLQLLPELGDARTEHVEFDNSRISALQENVSEVHERADAGFVAGTLKRSEARAMKGLQSDPDDEVYVDEVRAMSAAPTLDGAKLPIGEGRPDAQDDEEEQSNAESKRLRLQLSAFWRVRRARQRQKEEAKALADIKTGANCGT